MSSLAPAARAPTALLSWPRLVAAIVAAGAIAGVVAAAVWPIDLARTDGGSLYAAAKVP